MALRRQQPETVADILGSERAAIGKARFGPQPEGDALSVIRHIGTLGHQSVDGIGLVGGARHQRVEHQLHALGRIALEDVAVEAVEGVAGHDPDERHLPALRRIRIDVVEVLEIGGILEVAEDRQAVLRRGQGRGGKQQAEAGGREKPPHLAATLPARAASHHQMLGKPTL